MKLPITIDKLINMWSEDCKIDILNLISEITRTPEIHSKYLNIHSYHSLIIKKITIDYNILKKTKYEYLNGDLNNPEDLKELNLSPMVKKIYKPDMIMHIDADKDLNNLLSKKAINQEIVNVCESIIKEISNRSYHINSIIKWKQFQDGSI